MAEQEVGIVLIVLGVVFMAVGWIFLPICGLGLVLLIIGIVLMVTERPATQYYAAQYNYPPPVYGAPPSQPGYPGQPAAGAPPVGTPSPAASCYVCGTPLTWVPQYGRWYCTRCQSYR